MDAKWLGNADVEVGCSLKEFALDELGGIRNQQRAIAELYGFTLREPIPTFPLPLKPGDEELAVDLQAIVKSLYDRAGYDFRIDYRQPLPPPALSEAEQCRPL